MTQSIYKGVPSVNQEDFPLNKDYTIQRFSQDFESVEYKRVSKGGYSVKIGREVLWFRIAPYYLKPETTQEAPKTTGDTTNNTARSSGETIKSSFIQF